MEKVYEKEKSSRKTRDKREKDRDSTKDNHRDRDIDSSNDHHRDVDRHQDRDHKHRSRDDRSRHSEERHHSNKHREEKRLSKDQDGFSDRVSTSRHSKDDKHRDDIDRHRSRDYSEDYERKRERSEQRNGREGSNDGVSREESVERRSYSSTHHKRKERGESEDQLDRRSDKRSRVLDAAKEERKEKRRFEDKILQDSKDVNGIANEERREGKKFENEIKEEVVRDVKGSSREGRRDRRKFDDGTKEYDVEVAKEEKQSVSEEKQVKDAQLDNNQITATSNGSSLVANGAAPDPIITGSSRVVPETASAPSLPLPTKVSSIFTTNENKGVNVTRSHEVPGKSSTDGSTASVASKSGSLSLDALAKAKKALQMQKELSEKLKKIPLLNKGSSSSSDSPHMRVIEEGPKTSLTSTGSLDGTVPPTGSVKPLAGLTTMANYEAVKRAQELAAKMGFHHDPEFAPLINMFPGKQIQADIAVTQKPAKAPVLRLDALGREIDEHGNVVNMPKSTNLSTLKVNINKQKKEAFQILRPELDVDPDSNPHFDARMGINKTKLLRPKRMSFQFVEEGQWSKQAEIIRFKSQFGEAQAKELKTKQAQLAKAKAELDINPNLIEVSERVVTKEKPKDPIPETEWWDVPLLPSATYGDITKDNNAEYKLKMEKITVYVEHPLPIEPPAEPAPPPPQPLKLTKKEQKKLRTQRRLTKEMDRQEMIRQGLLEPPKPKIKMSNLMKVLGSEATQDPTRLEMEIRSAAAEREQAHVDRNIARKLTPAERREKKERKLFEDLNTIETIVSVYRINDLSDPKTRFKVDVNAQENRLTGCAVISDGISVIIVEGGSKPIKRYGKLMLRRINWATAVVNEEDDDENEDKPANKCVLVWQGSVAKPSFNRFFVHQCRTEAAARKVFSDAGVGHYWDLALNFSDDQI